MEKIPGKIKEMRFTRDRVKIHWVTLLGTKKFPEAYSCKYLGIFLRNGLNCVDKVNYAAQKPGGHFTL